MKKIENKFNLIVLFVLMTVSIILPKDAYSGGPVIITGLDVEWGIRPGNPSHGSIPMWAGVIRNGILNNVGSCGGILVVGGGKGPFATDEMTNFWTQIGADPQVNRPVTFVNGAAAIAAQSFAGFSMIAICNTDAGVGMLTQAELTAISRRRADIASFVNAGGGLYGSSCGLPIDRYGYLNFGNTLISLNGGGPNSLTLARGFALGLVPIAGPYHNIFIQWPNFLYPLSFLPGGGACAQICILGGSNVNLPSTDDWTILGNNNIIAPINSPVGYGNPISTGNFIGTRTNMPLVMATNNIERMRITEGGNVGIGTALPTCQLTNTDINFGEFGAGTNSGSFNWYNNNNTVSGGWNAISSKGQNGLVVATEGTGGTPFQVSSGTHNAASRANRLLTVRGDGRVGVGVINPVGQLANTDINFGEFGAGTSTGSLNWYNNVIGSAWNAISSKGNNGLVVATEGTGGTPFQVSSGTYNAGERVNRIFTVSGNGHVGINNINPGNKLEITKTANIVNGQWVYPNSGESGLRFSNLRAKAPMVLNPGSGVLSVDDNGDVIYVEDQSIGARNGLQVNAGFAELGRECGSTTQAANLTNSRELPMSNFNFLFSDGGNLSSNSAQNNVGIGSFGNCNLLAKLDVRRLGSSTEPHRIGVRSQVSHSNQDEALSIAFDGITNTLNNTNIGARLNVSNGISNTGTEISVNGGQQNATGANMVVVGGNADGIRLTVSGEQNTMGINATVNSNSSIATGMRIRNLGNPPAPYTGGNGNVGIDVITNSDANNLYPDYGVYAEVINPGLNDYAFFSNGNSFANGFWLPSDKKLKKEVEPIKNALATLDKLNPKKYDFNDETIKYLNLPKAKDNYGFIAQELEEVLPSLVKETIVPNRDKDSKEVNKINAVNYIELIPITISAIKELNAKVEKQNNAVIENEALKSEIASLKSDNEMMKEKFALLEKTITQLCESGCEGLKKTGEGSSSEVDVLYQSIPNPTDSEALINYSLSKEYANAYITVSTQEGKQLISVKLDAKKGSGSIKISLGELANGTYLYTLVTGERVIDTKRLQIVK